MQGEMLRIHVLESDRHAGKPLYEAIVARCREMEMAGATVFRGLEGYGENAELHKGHLLHSEAPIIITVVDAPEKIERLIPAISELVDTGLLATSPVEMIRVRQAVSPANPIPPEGPR